jgi:hypothetical protein
MTALPNNVTFHQMTAGLAGDMHWNVKVMTYDVNNNLTYMACNVNMLAATTATTWYIWKYTWTSSNCTQIEGPLRGSVTGQASLSWRP